MATKKPIKAASKSSSDMPATVGAEDEAVSAADDAGSASARVKAPSLRIKTLIDRVAEATGGKKKGLKEIVEATLTALGDALSKGEDLNLPGFGRTRTARTVERGGASLMTLKMRRVPHKKRDGAGKEALAEGGEDS